MVTDEDEAADIDQEKASALLDSNAAGAEGVARASAPSTSTPPMKRKDKKPKRVCKHAVYISVLFKNDSNNANNDDDTYYLDHLWLKNITLCF